MAIYSERVFETRRVEFSVPASRPWGADWAEVMKAISAARQQLVAMELIEEHAEASADQIRLLPGDDEVIVFYTVERNVDGTTWRTV